MMKSLQNNTKWLTFITISQSHINRKQIDIELFIKQNIKLIDLFINTSFNLSAYLHFRSFVYYHVSWLSKLCNVKRNYFEDIDRLLFTF